MATKEEKPNVIERQGHTDGHTDLAVTSDGKKWISGGEDTNVYSFDANDISAEGGTMESSHVARIKSVASKGRWIAAGDHEGKVLLYSYPQNEFVTILLRAPLEISQVVFDSTATHVAIASLDNQVSVVDVADPTKIQVFRHKGRLRSVAVDPLGEFLVASCAEGTVWVWNYGAKTTLEKTMHVFTATHNDDVRCQVDFHPSGQLVAVGGGVDVKLLERNGWVVGGALKGEHKAPVSLVAFSPNGAYLASVDADATILVWNVATKQCVARLKHKVLVTGLAWHPTGTVLGFADRNGFVNAWVDVVPAGAPAKVPAPPAAPAPAPAATGASPAGSVAAGAPPAEPATAARPPAAPASDNGSDEPLHRRRPTASATKRPLDRGLSDVDDDDSDVRPSPWRSSARKRQSRSRLLAYDVDGDPLRDDDEGGATTMQAPFQPSSTEAVRGRRYLVWNMVGLITAREEDAQHVLDVEFHDRSLRRPSHRVDPYMSTMAALSADGVVTASPKRDDTPSVIQGMPLGAWAVNADWAVRLEGDEEVVALAIGGAWCAAATSLRFLRLYSLSGAALAVLSAPGPVVAMAGTGAYLFVVYHRGSTFDGDQALGFWLFDVEQKRTVARDALPLCPGATLQWLGFTDGGTTPVTYDSNGVLRGLVVRWDAVWVPLLDVNRLPGKDQRSESYWPVGVTDTEFICVVCKGSNTAPSVTPRPIVSNFALQIPLVVSDTATLTQEAAYVRDTVMLDVARWEKSRGAAGANPDEDIAVRKLKVDADSNVLRHVGLACKRERPLRALELCDLLLLPSSWDAAVKIALHHKMVQLAEQIGQRKEARQSRPAA